MFARLDLGLDWTLDAKDSVIGKALHDHLGVGLDVGPAAVMLESENATLFSDSTSGGASNQGDACPYLAWVLPVDRY